MTANDQWWFVDGKTGERTPLETHITHDPWGNELINFGTKDWLERRADNPTGRNEEST